ncbi:MAG: HAD family hydrolase [Pseudomonadales bacterium]
MKILFDVDGVLIDGGDCDSARRKPWSAALQQDLGVDPARFDAAFFAPGGDGARSLMQRCLRGELDLQLALERVLRGLDCEVRAEVFIDYWFRKDSCVNVEMLAAVEHLAAQSGVELYLATGQEHRRADYLWNELGFRRYFRGMFYSARVGHLKTEPEFFAAIHRALGDRPPPLFFDDQPEVVRLARRAGFDATVVYSVAEVVEHPRLRQFFRHLPREGD